MKQKKRLTFYQILVLNEKNNGWSGSTKRQMLVKKRQRIQSVRREEKLNNSYQSPPAGGHLNKDNARR